MFGAAGVIMLTGPAQDCMKVELANKKAGRPYNTLRCTSLPMAPAPTKLSSTPTATSPGGLPTIVWVGLGIAAVGGLAYYVMKRH